MKAMIKSTINAMVAPAGIRIVKRNPAPSPPPQIEAQYLRLIGEMEGACREFLFPDLPTMPGRQGLMRQLLGTQIPEAIHLLAYLHRSLSREGDLCEFGVAQGATSALMANEIRTTSKRLWLFDSFEGLPRPTAKDQLIDDIFNLGSIEHYAGKMACSVDQVIQRLKDIGFPLDRVTIVPGFIEESSKSTSLPERVCFAYVDFDFYEPIKIALELLDSRMHPGGHIVVDDYGFFSSGAKDATDEFVAESGGRFTPLLPPAWAGKFCVLKKVSF